MMQAIVFGRREPLQRHIVEEGIKPAIFGSYSYDPIRQVFDPPPPDKNETVPSQFFNKTHVLSTVIGQEDQKQTTLDAKNASMFFRKHVTHKTTPWWARPKLHMNSTTKLRHNDKFVGNFPVF
ncbi:hypothetical protein O3G_MSEX007522 [Manduca sexta]|uniref:Uncharacterized protein n=1 Tax=Manduca sexta TaxID=7130 RepID=A0A921Z7J0_MANSE|nr:hypothetical protein O3G_MSEX007522 [Manduca sexta]